jgi:hypothetical protein
MHFRNSTLAASTMAKHSLNIDVNEISAAYYSDSEELSLNKFDTDGTRLNRIY